MPYNVWTDAAGRVLGMAKAPALQDSPAVGSTMQTISDAAAAALMTAISGSPIAQATFISGTPTSASVMPS